VIAAMNVTMTLAAPYPGPAVIEPHPKNANMVKIRNIAIANKRLEGASLALFILNPQREQ
jgi:hypothetical protein